MRAVPPKIRAAKTGSRWMQWLLLAVAAAGLATLFLFDPARHAFYPACQLHRLTGLNCPGCGMTRAVHALLHGDFLTALRDNALLVLALGFLLARAGWFCWNRRRGKTNGEFFPVKFLWLLLVLALIFAGLRNLPAFAFLSP